jgi:hypothetical protein
MVAFPTQPLITDVLRIWTDRDGRHFAYVPVKGVNGMGMVHVETLQPCRIGQSLAIERRPEGGWMVAKPSRDKAEAGDSYAHAGERCDAEAV